MMDYAVKVKTSALDPYSPLLNSSTSYKAVLEKLIHKSLTWILVIAFTYLSWGMRRQLEYKSSAVDSIDPPNYIYLILKEQITKLESF